MVDLDYNRNLSCLQDCNRFLLQLRKSLIIIHYLLKNHSLSGFESFLHEIIEFSGLGSYISLPIKTYSEGMSARLVFSILTSSPHDCLAIDEGFGTGDADFCDRAEERMKQFMESAATLFLASHSEELLKQFCRSQFLQ